MEAAQTWAKEHAVAEVQQWLADSASDGSADDCVDLIGFVKWGFTYAFRCVELVSKGFLFAAAMHNSGFLQRRFCSGFGTSA